MFHRAARGMPADDDVLYGEDGHGILDARRHVHLGLGTRALQEFRPALRRYPQGHIYHPWVEECPRALPQYVERFREGTGRPVRTRVSTTAKMRPVSGISSPFVPWGYPEPSYRS